MENTLSEEEFYRWQVYNKHEPLNSAEIQMALLMTIVSSALGGKNKPEDFMVSSPLFKEAQKVLDGQALNEMIKGMF